MAPSGNHVDASFTLSGLEGIDSVTFWGVTVAVIRPIIHARFIHIHHLLWS